MPKTKKPNIKNEIKRELKTITDTVDLDMVNQQLSIGGINNIEISSKTLMNIGKWCLDGKSEYEIKQNLELSDSEWRYLLTVCPAIVVVMQHTLAYADMIVGGTLFQTAIGGKIIKRKVPVKIKEYDFNPETGKSWVIGEKYEMVEVEEETQPNPYLLKFLAENKLSEKFGDKKTDNTREYKDVIESMTEEQIKAINEYKKS